MQLGETLMMIGDAMIFAGLLILVFAGLLYFIAKRLEARLHKQLDEIAEDLAANRLIPLTVEQYGDQYLCYNSLTMDFVCQGTDVKDIIAKFTARYPNKSASLYNGDETAIKTLKKQFQEIKNENSNSIRPTP